MSGSSFCCFPRRLLFRRCSFVEPLEGDGVRRFFSLAGAGFRIANHLLAGKSRPERSPE